MLRKDTQTADLEAIQSRFGETRFDWLKCVDGEERLIHIWEPAAGAADCQGILLAVHGGLAHAGDYCTLAEAFKTRNWTTVSFDMRGHNRQERVHIERFDDFLDDIDLLVEWIEGEFAGKPVFMVGHSMGGLIAAHHAIRQSTSKSTDASIKGYMLSSPFWANAVHIPGVVVLLSGLLSKVAPRMKAPIEDFTDVLTHDESITTRHRMDEADLFRASSATIRFASELMLAQEALEKTIDRWNKPVFAVVAGEDRLSDTPAVEALLDRIQTALLERHLYPDNFHENFNESNREEIYKLMDSWLKKQLNQ